MVRLLALWVLLITYSRPVASQQVYVGAGCFWHTQYDVAEVEKSSFKRQDAQVTASVGYTGGNSTGPGGLVCYHGGPPGSLYEDLGYAEAVGVVLDEDKATTQMKALMNKYFGEFRKTAQGMQRLDPADGGAWSKGAYRNNIGIPGGVHGPLMKVIRTANVHKMPLLEGRGINTDTCATCDEYKVYVYDTKYFPFYRGETYHQFHERSVLGVYSPPSYTQTLKLAQAKAGHIPLSGCDGGRTSNLQQVKPPPPPAVSSNMPMGGGVFSGMIKDAISGTSHHMCLLMLKKCLAGQLCGTVNYTTPDFNCAGHISLVGASPIPGVFNIKDTVTSPNPGCHAELPAQLGAISGGLGYGGVTAWGQGVLKKVKFCPGDAPAAAVAPKCDLKTISDACQDAPDDALATDCAGPCARVLVRCANLFGSEITPIMLGSFNQVVGKCTAVAAGPPAAGSH